MSFTINLFITIVICASLFLSNLMAFKPNQNIILNTTLPFSELDNKEVLDIIKTFKKDNIKYFFINIILNIPSFFITSDVISIIYLLLWVISIFTIYHIVIKKHITKLRNLKMKNNWFLKNKHVISIDTEVSRIKNKMPVSILWFIPSFLIAIGIIAYAITSEQDFSNYMIILSCASLFTTLIFLIIYKLFSAGKTKVYSDDSKVNLACNLIYKRIWSIILVLLSTVLSVLTIFQCFIYSYIVIISFIMVSLTIFITFAGYIKIRNTQTRILMAAENVIYTDDDEFWNFMFYNNPNDSNLLVEKRIGIGMTLNNGTGTSHIAFGNFKFDGYGPTKTYVHKDLDKIIVIKLPDKYVFFTGNSNKETDEYYKEFQSFLDKN
ncbi:DUF5808 domain-containing protein [Clostridium cibarium]|uniref:DUF5808 domain-containing protein n=1 Tax=Clostridium cibarium TaxID=2762247 RepID=A0ABR8PW56_9CLOT|nr:DUF5808 domain-containing protein [Clostridium cibarium]MBD7912369.1 hypothetical protein [Clostridium cibarium]